MTLSVGLVLSCIVSFTTEKTHEFVFVMLNLVVAVHVSPATATTRYRINRLIDDITALVLESEHR